MFEPASFQAVRTAVEILVAFRDLFPHALDVKAAALDKDWGTALLRQGLLSGKSAKDIVATWSAPVDSFMTAREKYLLYEGPGLRDGRLCVTKYMTLQRKAKGLHGNRARALRS